MFRVHKKRLSETFLLRTENIIMFLNHNPFGGGGGNIKIPIIRTIHNS